MTTDVSTTSSTSETDVGSSSSGPPGECGDGVARSRRGLRRRQPDDDDECPGSCAPAFCGDGYLRAGEACDDGNKANDDECTNACTLAACGDGVMQTDVEGATTATSRTTTGAPTACEHATCGDGIVHAGVEACDDGNLDDEDDDCHDDCTTPFCGDGEVMEGLEECDDGDLDDGDECTSLCTLAICGDGVIHVGVEACDDGNDVDEDACVACEDASCGDGVVQLGVEECDDMNDVNTDECSNKCVITPTGVSLVAGDVTPQFGGLMDRRAVRRRLSDGPGADRVRRRAGQPEPRQARRALQRARAGVQGDAFAVVTMRQEPAAGPRQLRAERLDARLQGRRGAARVRRSRGDRGRPADVHVRSRWSSPRRRTGRSAWRSGREPLMPIGGNNGVPFPQTDCPAGQVATVQRLRASTGVDAFGLGCSAVALTFD
jgi:cysteine-rich repeat protein